MFLDENLGQPIYNQKVAEAMDTTITTQPFDLNIIKDKFTGNSPRE